MGLCVIWGNLEKRILRIPTSSLNPFSMLRLLSLLLFSGILLSCNPSKRLLRQHSHVQYFPEVLQGLYMGMPLTEFLDLREVTEEDTGPNPFRRVFIEEAPQAGIATIVYYCDYDEPGYPLYEVIIQYQNRADRNEWVENNLGNPNSGTEWLYDSGEGFELNLWTFQQKLVLAASIPGTEWDEDRNGRMDAAIDVE